MISVKNFMPFLAILLIGCSSQDQGGKPSSSNDKKSTSCMAERELKPTAFDKKNDKSSKTGESFICRSSLLPSDIRDISEKLENIKYMNDKEKSIFIDRYFNIPLVYTKNGRMVELSKSELLKKWPDIFDREFIDDFDSIELNDWTPSPRDEGSFLGDGQVWIKSYWTEGGKISTINKF